MSRPTETCTSSVTRSMTTTRRRRRPFSVRSCRSRSAPSRPPSPRTARPRSAFSSSVAGATFACLARRRRRAVLGRFRDAVHPHRGLAHASRSPRSTTPIRRSIPRPSQLRRRHRRASDGLRRRHRAGRRRPADDDLRDLQARLQRADGRRRSSARSTARPSRRATPPSRSTGLAPARTPSRPARSTAPATSTAPPSVARGRSRSLTPTTTASTPRTDCNDANPAIFPGRVDVPDNGVDENCDGADAVSPPPSSSQSGGPAATEQVIVTVAFFASASKKSTKFTTLQVKNVPLGATVTA